MAIAVKGQHAYNFWGEEATLTEEFLRKDHKTWEGGLVSTNHEDTNDLLGGASLYDLEYSEETGRVIASFANLPDKAKAFINSEFYQGLSQECIPLQFKKDSNDVIKGYGTGVTIVMWPHQPAATPEMGVGVRPALAAILSFKYPTQTGDTMSDKPGGGTPAISVEAFESTVSENVQLKSQVKTLETRNTELEKELASWKQKYDDQVKGEADRTKIESERAVNAYKADLERGSIVSEMKEYLGDFAEKYFATNPSIETMKVDLEREKSKSAEKHVENSKGVGSGQNYVPPEEGRSYEELDREWNSKLGRN